MKTRTLFTAAMLFTLASFGQYAGKWITSNPGENVRPYAQTIGPDGNIYYCGAGAPTMPVGNRVYFAKTDTSGNIIWEKYVDSIFVGAVEIAVDENSIYLACYGNVLRFDVDGNFMWRKYIDVPNSAYVNDVMIDENGGCVIAGMQQLPLSPKKVAYIAKLDSTGMVEWDKQMFWSGYNSSFFFSLAKDNSNNIYACGGSGVSYTPVNAGTVAKFSSNGTLLWSRQVTVDSSTWISFYQCDFYANELVVAGSAFPGTPGIHNYFLRLDTFGFGFYAMVLPNDSLNRFNFNSLYCTPYNTVIVTGQNNTGSVFEGVIMELDYYFGFVRGLSHSTAQSITGVQMLNGQTFICGEASSGNIASFRGISDYSWNFGCGFISLDANPIPQFYNFSMPGDSVGNIILIDSTVTVANLNFQYTSCDNLAGITNPTISDFMMFPNPADASLTIKFGEALSEPQQVTILNTLGEIIDKQVCPAGIVDFQIRTSGLAAGAYIVHTENGINKPFIVAH